MSEIATIATADVAEWKPLATVPYATKCLLLTKGRIAVVGALSSNSDGYIAWSALPKIPAWLKQEIDQ